MLTTILAAVVLGQYSPGLMPTLGAPGQPALPPMGRVEQVPATEHYTPFGTIFEPPDRSLYRNAPRYYGEIAGPTFVGNKDPRILRGPTGTYPAASSARPPGLASRATTPNRPRTLREMRYGRGPVPGSPR